MNDLINRQAVIDDIKAYANSVTDALIMLENFPPSKPTGDTISRQAAIHDVSTVLWHIPNELYKNLNSFDFVKEIVTEALSETPSLPSLERKGGEWVKSEIPNELYVCSKCGGACWSYDYERNIVKSNFCPNCGADMRPKDGEEE